MAVKKIVQNGDQVLRKKAKPVVVGEIKDRSIVKVIKDMSDTLETTTHGVALAAPQIGVSLRIFVVSPKAFVDTSKDEKLPPNTHLVYINPKIIRRSRKKVILDEGCLSVDGVYGKIKRHTHATVEAYDENGDKFTDGRSGLLAEIFQHEIDHLDGTLFIDTATDLVEIEPENGPKE